MQPPFWSPALAPSTCWVTTMVPQGYCVALHRQVSFSTVPTPSEAADATQGGQGAFGDCALLCPSLGKLSILAEIEGLLQSSLGLELLFLAFGLSGHG